MKKAVPIIFLWISNIYYFSSLLDVNQEWAIHKIKFELSLPQEEEIKRRKIFEENYFFIKEFNAKNSGVILEMNKFGHYKRDEVFNCYHNETRNPRKTAFVQKLDLPVRLSMDWREYGVVSSVKNQKRCGSCYAFAAIAAMESHFAIQTGVLENLSEQEIVDCSLKYGNNACNGGLPDHVFKYCMANGVASMASYNYTAKEGYCHHINKHHQYRLISFVDLPQADESQLVRTLSFVGPVSIALDANHKELMFYKSGILKIPGCSQENLNHATLAVGYSLKDKPYLIVKNSWGTDWGESGYFKIALFEQNMCGVATYASYPIPWLSSVE